MRGDQNYLKFYPPIPNIWFAFGRVSFHQQRFLLTVGTISLLPPTCGTFCCLLDVMGDASSSLSSAEECAEFCSSRQLHFWKITSTLRRPAFRPCCGGSVLPQVWWFKSQSWEMVFTSKVWPVGEGRGRVVSGKPEVFTKQAPLMCWDLNSNLWLPRTMLSLSACLLSLGFLTTILFMPSQESFKEGCAYFRPAPWAVLSSLGFLLLRFQLLWLTVADTTGCSAREGLHFLLAFCSFWGTFREENCINAGFLGFAFLFSRLTSLPVPDCFRLLSVRYNTFSICPEFVMISKGRGLI